MSSVNIEGPGALLLSTGTGCRKGKVAVPQETPRQSTPRQASTAQPAGSAARSAILSLGDPPGPPYLVE